MATTTANTSATTGDDIARSFLRTIGAPDTPLLRKAVIAWIRAESGNSVRAGNPWNITYGAAQEIARKGGPKPIGSWTSQSSGLKFAVYPSAIVGAQASGKLLLGAGHDWRGYDKIIDAARRNDPIGFLNALAKSAWDGGRYGTKNGGPNKLIGIYGSLGGDTSGISFGTRGGGTFDAGSGLPPMSSGTLLAKLRELDIPILEPDGITPHKLTAAEASKLIAAFGGKVDTSGIAAGKTVAEITSVRTNQVDPSGDFFASAGDFIRAVIDPGNWVRILALFAGAGIVAYGGVTILHAAGAPAPTLPTPPGIPVP